MKHRIFFEGIIRIVYIEPFEKLTFPFEERMKSRTHEALAVTARADNGVIVVEFVLYKIMNVFCLVDIDVVAFRSYVVK